MRRFFFAIIVLLITAELNGQAAFTSYFTGDTADVVRTPVGGVCMMGGASEVDEAMQWFLNRADGGDVLVLRISGSDGYNQYLYSDLGIQVNSVETIVFDDTSAAHEGYILRRIQEAEAIWIPGGDQWDYVTYWRSTPLDSAIRDAIVNRNIVYGGTSAGMALLGEYYFTAQNGTITSSQALGNPQDSRITIDSTDFISHPWLDNVVTDTHFDNPDRRGRLVSFIANLTFQSGSSGEILGVALDEYTAICLNDTGIARIYGSYPQYDDNAFFVRVNCHIPNNVPEQFSAGSPLTWDRGNEAISVYRVKGTPQGLHYFDMQNRTSGSGGEWLNWYVNNGVLEEDLGSFSPCNVGQIENYTSDFTIFPNPASERVTIEINDQISQLFLFNNLGECVYTIQPFSSDQYLTLDISGLPSGMYHLVLRENSGYEQTVDLVITSP